MIAGKSPNHTCSPRSRRRCRLGSLLVLWSICEYQSRLLRVNARMYNKERPEIAERHRSCHQHREWTHLMHAIARHWRRSSVDTIPQYYCPGLTVLVVPACRKSLGRFGEEHPKIQFNHQKHLQSSLSTVTYCISLHDLLVNKPHTSQYLDPWKTSNCRVLLRVDRLWPVPATVYRCPIS